MQTSGVPFSPAIMRQQLQILDHQLRYLLKLTLDSKWVFEGASLDSPADVGVCLFEHLKLPPPPSAIKAIVGGVAARKQKYSTDKAILDALITETRHPFPKVLKEYRALKRAYGEAEALLEMVPSANASPSTPVRIRCSMSQTGT